jgi:hypothetical protein
MRTLLVAITLTTTAATASAAPEDADGMAKSATMKDWSGCLESYVENAVGVLPMPDGARLLPLDQPVGKFAAGATPTIGELEAECLAQAKNTPRSEITWARKIEREIGLVRKSSNLLLSPDFASLSRAAARCRAMLELANVAGDPKQPIKVYASEDGPGYAGEMAGARTFCADAQATADSLLAAWEKPFIAGGLRNDKLARVVAGRGQTPYYANGKRIDAAVLDVPTLVAASVWFESVPGFACPHEHNGPSHTVTRLQFDANGKLVKTSMSQPYCGEPPASAFH